MGFSHGPEASRARCGKQGVLEKAENPPALQFLIMRNSGWGLALLDSPGEPSGDPDHHLSPSPPCLTFCTNQASLASGFLIKTPAILLLLNVTVFTGTVIGPQVLNQQKSTWGLAVSCPPLAPPGADVGPPC